MIVNCEQVLREISKYLEDNVDPNLRAAIELHFRGCKHCKAVLDCTRNVIQLYRDQRIIELPLGFHQRLHRTLEQNSRANRRSLLAWMAAAAALVITGSFEVARLSVFNHPDLRSQHAQRGSGVPPDEMVVVSAGRVFHASLVCPFIHDKTHVRTIVAREAMKDGYAPCVRCMKRYLRADLNSPPTRKDRRSWALES